MAATVKILDMLNEFDRAAWHPAAAIPRGRRPDTDGAHVDPGLCCTKSCLPLRGLRGPGRPKWSLSLSSIRSSFALKQVKYKTTYPVRLLEPICMDRPYVASPM
jgi:hypothetical protein